MNAKPEITASLSEVNRTVDVDSKRSFLKKLFAFAGPAYLVSVGYMDPGNWATDLEGGARFGYDLLWVLVLSNAIAILLQTLSARLGIVSRLDLAQACRRSYPPYVSVPLWVLCEIAIAACDLAEILGAAIGLKLLFGLPMMVGVLLTAFDTLILLWFTRYGIRVVEAVVLVIVAVIGACFAIELWMAKPVFSEIARGLIPKLNDQSLYVAIGILGATVMPHNLYLHSALVQTRRIGSSEKEKRDACRFNFFDSVIALNGALLVNGAILVLAASVFFKRSLEVTQIEQAHVLLAPLLGTAMASALFAVALLLAGQSSTITGTLAGQIVMEGFLNFRIQPWLRRLLTRLIAIIPAVFTIATSGEKGTYQLLILSQVILSMQLPFAIIPLIHFTSDRKTMGPFTNRLWVRVLAWAAAAIIVGLNLRLAGTTLADWSETAGGWFWPVLIPVLLMLLALLVYVTFEPFLPENLRMWGRAAHKPRLAPEIAAPAKYHRILVPLDHSERDRDALAHAVATAKLHSATIHLLHVEEGVTSQLYGALASTEEVEEGVRYFDEIAAKVRAEGIATEVAVVHAKTPREAIIQYSRDIHPDLVIMGAHGHSGLKDLIFGTTINAVRHGVAAPVLIVGPPANGGRDGGPQAR